MIINGRMIDIGMMSFYFGMMTILLIQLWIGFFWAPRWRKAEAKRQARKARLQTRAQAASVARQVVRSLHA